ncbi:MAG: DUF1194 domain-containing protein [Alphaproteobacteria bacterium]|nr:DUF1194 domain-containing protein [Alphaproteobacteria bacterium]MBU0796512.1 DUF1194 domain-containing protein [Alphaproteobacteria bacterium]MBU0888074.1 DUF1194 domain-containing protein [Alphaproteobacteria bacterium]MBU1811519.1 DUF1194 domain-containing protein [Alphaproteobacteria bacterium]
MRRIFGWLTVLALVLVSPGMAKSAADVDLLLVLAADGSGSIDPDEFALQREGYAQAISDPRVVQAIQSGYSGAIAVAMMEWGAPTSQHIIVNWTVIRDQASAEGFAAALLAAPRKAFGYNSISNAIAFSANMMRESGITAPRKVIDLSGDGPQIGGMALPVVREAAIDEDITINALAINNKDGMLRGPMGQPLDEHYRNDVIGGFGAFVIVADSRAHLREALLQKLIREIADAGPTGRSVARRD